ncbi:TPA: hypothetical protein CPT91_08675 [Candidatus Gastranaerophilales bacterium HUM_16]|nr:MAG TPA: hypothetical protein CPT91_08675 [Candidatus Gastranaerophilales bacterium HUM_16]
MEETKFLKRKIVDSFNASDSRQPGGGVVLALLKFCLSLKEIKLWTLMLLIDLILFIKHPHYLYM